MLNNKKTTLVLVLALQLISLVMAGQDYCIPGSDTLCKRYGSDYCCAKINISKNGIADEYHSCSSSEGISLTDGKFMAGGYSGTW